MVELRLGEAEHPAAVGLGLQPARRHLAQGAAGAQPAPGDHQHAAVAARLGGGEERGQPAMRLGLGEAVQVEPRVDRIAAAAQLEPGAAVEIDRAGRVEPASGRGSAAAAPAWAQRRPPVAVRVRPQRAATVGGGAAASARNGAASRTAWCQSASSSWVTPRWRRIALTRRRSGVELLDDQHQEPLRARARPARAAGRCRRCATGR